MTIAGSACPIYRVALGMILGVGIWNIAESLADALITVGGIVLFAFELIRGEPDPQAKYC